MATAIRMNRLVEARQVTYASLARMENLSRARVTQIMGLANLAPDIQEEILDLPAGCLTSERAIRPICMTLDWGEQRILWNRVCRPDPAT